MERPTSGGPSNRRRSRSTTSDIRIAHHNAKKEPWLEVVIGNQSLHEAFASCLGVPYVDRATLLKDGIDGGPWPSIDYSPSFGFYRLGYVPAR